MLHPERALRTCGDCIRYVYDDDGPVLNPVTGDRVPRMADDPLPCDRCPKIPKDAPKTRFQAVELDSRGWQAVDHNRRCRAVGRFEDDEAVEAVAAIVMTVREQVAEERRVRETLGLMKAAMAGAMFHGIAKGG